MSGSFSFAEPWWVNLTLVIPLASFLHWRFRSRPLRLTTHLLFLTALFGLAFAFIEASVVVYLRASANLLPEFVSGLSLGQCTDPYQQLQTLQALPARLISLERLRELSTLAVIAIVTALSAKTWPERWAIFLWMIAWWGLFYYGFLYLLLGWPCSLLMRDVLFLVPTTWFSQLWLPVLEGVLIIGAVLFSAKMNGKK